MLHKLTLQGRNIEPCSIATRPFCDKMKISAVFACAGSARCIGSCWRDWLPPTAHQAGMRAREDSGRLLLLFDEENRKHLHKYIHVQLQKGRRGSSIIE